MNIGTFVTLAVVVGIVVVALIGTIKQKKNGGCGCGCGGCAMKDKCHGKDENKDK